MSILIPSAGRARTPRHVLATFFIVSAAVWMLWLLVGHLPSADEQFTPAAAAALVPSAVPVVLPTAAALLPRPPLPPPPQIPATPPLPMAKQLRSATPPTSAAAASGLRSAPPPPPPPKRSPLPRIASAPQRGMYQGGRPVKLALDIVGGAASPDLEVVDGERAMAATEWWRYAKDAPTFTQRGEFRGRHADAFGAARIAALSTTFEGHLPYAQAGHTKLTSAYGRYAAKQRSPVFPFISGDGFRYICEHACEGAYGGCSFRSGAQIKAGDCIFIATTNLANADMITTPRFLDAFAKLRPQIKVPYVLITHNGDMSTPDGDAWHTDENEVALRDQEWNRTYTQWFKSPLLLGWFAQNCHWKTVQRPDRLFCIPIGLPNRGLGCAVPHYDWGVFMKQYAASPRIRDGLRGRRRRGVDPSKILALGFGVETIQHKPDRTILSRQLRGSWITRMEWPSPVKAVHAIWIEHMFVACPHGHGYDTHRLWDVLLSGGFALVRSSPLDSMYTDLPVLIVREWEDATPELLRSTYKEFMARTDWAMDRLFMPYWRDYIRTVQNRSVEGALPHLQADRAALNAAPAQPQHVSPQSRVPSSSASAPLPPTILAAALAAGSRPIPRSRSITYSGGSAKTVNIELPRMRDELAMLRWRWREPLPPPVAWPGEWSGRHVDAFTVERGLSAPCPNRTAPLATWRDDALLARLASNKKLGNDALLQLDAENTAEARRSVCRTTNGAQASMPYEPPRSKEVTMHTQYGRHKGASRYPYWPFVVGDAFRYRCEHRCEDDGCSFKAADVEPGDCIFIGTTILAARRPEDGMRTMPLFIDAFGKIRPQITVPYVVVTHNGDLSTPDGDTWHNTEDAKATKRRDWSRTEYHAWLESPLLLGWFAQNCYFSDAAPRPAKLHCIPIGLTNRVGGGSARLAFGEYGAHLEQGQLKEMRSCWGAKGIGHCVGGATRPIYAPACLSEDPDPHTILLMGFSVSSSARRPDRLLAARAFRGSWPTRLPWGQAADVVWKLIAGHMFVACPHGHGYDTHRLWTVLLNGGFPLVRSSPLDSMYEGLPVLIVNEWQDATKEFLVAKYAEFVARIDWKMDRIFMPYWDYRMRLVQGRLTEVEKQAALNAAVR